MSDNLFAASDALKAGARRQDNRDVLERLATAVERLVDVLEKQIALVEVANAEHEHARDSGDPDYLKPSVHKAKFQ